MLLRCQNNIVKPELFPLVFKMSGVIDRWGRFSQVLSSINTYCGYNGQAVGRILVVKKNFCWAMTFNRNLFLNVLLYLYRFFTQWMPTHFPILLLSVILLKRLNEFTTNLKNRQITHVMIYKRITTNFVSFSHKIGVNFRFYLIDCDIKLVVFPQF